MKYVLMFIIMIVEHIIADYNLQGWLAQAKQREWWEKNYPEELYSKDYLCAMLMHCIQWTFLVMLPLLIYLFLIGENFSMWVGQFIVNVIIHFLTDDAKANKKALSLWGDQVIHIVQIILTIVVLM